MTPINVAYKEFGDVQTQDIIRMEQNINRGIKSAKHVNVEVDGGFLVDMKRKEKVPEKPRQDKNSTNNFIKALRDGGHHSNILPIQLKPRDDQNILGKHKLNLTKDIHVSEKYGKQNVSSAESPCRGPNVTLLDKPRDKTALASFPGSGNTWVRYLLQQITGKIFPI